MVLYDLEYLLSVVLHWTSCRKVIDIEQIVQASEALFVGCAARTNPEYIQET
jgi:hypothetical protein